MVGKKAYLFFLACTLGFSTVTLPGGFTPDEGKRYPSEVDIEKDHSYAGRRKDVAITVREYIENQKKIATNEATAPFIKFLKKGGRTTSVMSADIADFFLKDPAPCGTINVFIAQGSAHLKKMKDSVSASDYAECQKMFLLKTIALLDRYCNETMYQVVKGLDKNLRYWKEQQSHQWYYFLHKSPLKWFGHTAQKDEIERIIQNLKALKRHHFKLMGELATKADELELLSCDNHLLWSSKYLSLMRYQFAHLLNMKSFEANDSADKKIEELAPEFDALLNQIRDVLTTKVKDYPRHFALRTADLNMPSHLARRWFDYAGAALILAGVGGYCYYHRDSMINSLKSNYLDPAKKSFYRLFPWADPHKKEKHQQKSSAAVLESYKKVRDNLVKVVDQLGLAGANVSPEERQKKYKDKVSEYVTFARENGLNGFNIPDDFNQKAAALDPEFLIRVIKHSFENWEKVNTGLRSGYSQQKELLKRNYEFILVYLSNYINDVNTIVQTGIVPEGKEVLDSIINLALDAQDKLDRLETMTNFIGLVPLLAVSGGACYGLYRLGRWFIPKPDFKPMKIALMEIGDILMEYEGAGEIASHHYGELLYLVKKLHEEERIVPKQFVHHYKNDINKLESGLSFDRRLYVLQNMYRRYPFLAAKAAA